MVNDRFVVESRLDEGPLGTVYQAIDRHEPEDSTSRRVALWLLPDELTRNKGALAAFVRGLDALRALRHESIVRIYDYGRHGDRHFVTSELVDGETLRNVVDHLRPERLEYDEVDEVLVEIGDALAYLHDQGLAHGDVRPENVLVTVDQRFKLVNLAASSLVSTAVSASPRADTRDFAAMAYELYGGQAVPWEGKLRRLRSLGKARCRALEQALSNDPRYREMTMHEFLSQCGLTIRPSLGRIVAPRIRARRTSRGVWKLPAVAGILLAAVVVYSDGRIGSLVTSAQQGLQDLRAAIAPGGSPSGAEVPSRAVEVPPVAGRAAVNDSGSFEAAARLASPERLEAPPAGAGTAQTDTDEAGPGDDYGSAVEAPSAPSGADFAGDPPALPQARLSLSSSALVARESLRGLSFDVVRSGDASDEITFAWWTSEDTALAGDDFASFGRRVERLAAGQSSATFYVPLTSDALPEPDKRFFIHLATEGSSAELGDIPTAQVTLIDDDR